MDKVNKLVTDLAVQLPVGGNIEAEGRSEEVLNDVPRRGSN